MSLLGEFLLGALIIFAVLAASSAVWLLWVFASCFAYFWIRVFRFPTAVFNQTPALKKLYQFARENRICFIMSNGWGHGLRIFFIRLDNVILVGPSIGRAAWNNGIEEITFAHELGHWQNSRRNRAGCPNKRMYCLIEEELSAWEEGLKILENLGFRVNGREYWKYAALCLATYCESFAEQECNELFKANCPLAARVGAAELAERVADEMRMFNNTLPALLIFSYEPAEPVIVDPATENKP